MVPTQPVFTQLINAPVFAFFGFEYYATTGAFFLGLLLGCIWGAFLIRIVSRYRRTMINLEENSERYQKYTAKKSVRFATWLFLGKGQDKATYEKLLTKPVGLPVRPIGVIAAVLTVVLLFLLQMFFAEPIVTTVLRNSLERANGATVDVQAANLDLGSGTLSVEGLALADPNALDTDIFRATTLTADISSNDLLRKRMTFDHIVIADASTGATRAVPGRIIGPKRQPTAEDEDGITPEAEEKTIEDYIESAEQWRDRLAQLKDWLERIAGPDPDEEDAGKPDGETIREQIRELGRARVIASHLIREQPTLTITLLEANGIRAVQLEDEVLDLRGEHLSTHPALVGEPPHILLTSQSGDIFADVLLRAGPESSEQDIDVHWEESGSRYRGG